MIAVIERGIPLIEGGIPTGHNTQTSHLWDKSVPPRCRTHFITRLHRGEMCAANDGELCYVRCRVTMATAVSAVIYGDLQYTFIIQSTKLESFL